MKTKRYWLRGGLILVGILLVVTVVLFFSGITSSGFFRFPAWTVLPLFTSTFLVRPIFFVLNGVFAQSAVVVLLLLLDLIIFFFVGSFFGWLYGKIKNRNKIPQV